MRTRRARSHNSRSPSRVRRTTPAGTKPATADPGRMTVTGRVLDPAGKPAAGVPVDIIGRARRTPRSAPMCECRPTTCWATARPTATAASASRRRAPRSASLLRGLRPGRTGRPGSGFGWTALNPDAEQPAADIRLQPEQLIRGRLVDVNGQPAAGVEVQLQWSTSPPAPGVYDRYRPPVDGVLCRGIPAWPKPVTTDAQGRFTFAGIGRGYRLPPRPRPPLRLAAIRPQGRRARRGQGGHAGPPAGDDHRGPCPRRRHRPADPQRRHLREGQLRRVRRDVHDQVPRRRSGTVQDQPLRGRLFPDARPSPPRASPTWSGRMSSRGPRGRSRRRSISSFLAAC